MPVRLLKPKLRTSRKWNACSYIAQTAYVRFIMLVDDAGRYFGHPKLLASELFPLGGPRGEDVGTVEVNTILKELSRNRLVELYEHEGETFVSLTNWEERVRTKSKFPEPPGCDHSQTNANNCSQMRASPPSPSPSPSSNSTPVGKQVLPSSVSTTFDATRIANEIISDRWGWWWDNCKVKPEDFKTRPLASVIEAFMPKSEAQIRVAWLRAVKAAHGAVVDGLVKGSAAGYCIQCFRDECK